MAEVLRVVLVEVTCRVSLPPPNGDRGYWVYDIQSCVEQQKPVAKVSHQITGMKTMKPVGCFLVDRVSTKTMIALAEHVASQTPLPPPEGKGRPKTKKPEAWVCLTRFEVELDGVDNDGMPRICEVVIDWSEPRMNHNVQQPDGRWFWEPRPERLTAKVRQKTLGCKCHWRFFPCEKNSKEEAERVAVAHANAINW